MIELLLRILGWQSDDVQRVGGWGIGLGNAGALLWAIPLGVVLAAVVIWSYRNIAREVPGARPVLLSTVRIVLLVLLLSMFLRPVLGFTAESEVRRALIFLIDTSASMKIEDARATPDDRKRSAIALGLIDEKRGLNQDLPQGASGLNVSRMKLVKEALSSRKIDLLPRLSRDFDLRVMTFGQKATGVGPTTAPTNGENASTNGVNASGWIDTLEPVAPVTATGDVLRDVISASRGQQLGGVVVVTDGGINTGLPGAAAAQLAKQDGVPLFMWGVGISDVRDILLAELFAPETAFKDDSVPVSVRVRNRGLAGETVALKLKLNDEVVVSRDIQLDPAGEQVVALDLAPKKQGEFTLSAIIEPREDEAVRDNNAVTQHLRVVDGKLKVLYVEQSPRWEFHYLQAQLARDRRVDAKFVLVEADPGVASENSPYLKSFPLSRDELFKYDLIIIGDVAPASLGAEAPALLDEYVSKFAGGVLMIAGRRSTPAAYFDTPVGKMLPVERDGASERSAQPTVDEKPISIDLTPDGKTDPVTKLADDPATSARMWASRRPLFWAFTGVRAKPAAQVLLQLEGSRPGSRTGATPLVALQQFGAGTVGYVGTDNTWRWRADAGVPVYTAFWGQMVQRLALPHFLGASPRTRLTSERRTYAVYDKIVLFARLYDVSFKPVSDPSVDATIESTTGVKTPLTLRPVPDQPGLYRGETEATEVGQYRFGVNRDPDTRIDFSVAEAKLEFAETAMNETVLRQMATVSGGAFLREEDLYKLPDQIKAKHEWVKTRVELELALTPIYFAVLVLLASAEWFVRKRVELK